MICIITYKTKIYSLQLTFKRKVTIRFLIILCDMHRQCMKLTTIQTFIHVTRHNFNFSISFFCKKRSDRKYDWNSAMSLDQTGMIFI